MSPSRPVHFPASKAPSARISHLERKERRQRFLKHSALDNARKLSPLEALAYRETDPMQCLLCGIGFQKLGHHLGLAHDVTARAYCAAYGIPYVWKRARGLATPAQRERMKEAVPEAQVERAATLHLLNQGHGGRGVYTTMHPDTLAARAAVSATPLRACEWCEKTYRPIKARQRFCSRQCARYSSSKVLRDRIGWPECNDCGKRLTNRLSRRCSQCYHASRVRIRVDP